MSLRSVPIEEIEEGHLRRLVEDGVVEARNIDYKLTLPRGSDADKREFLADVSSFANAGGGDIVFGADESGGAPTDVPGLDVDLDDAVLRLESSVRDGVAPRIQGLRSHPIPLGNGKSALVLRVPRSFSRPHVVVFKNWSRFFTRSSNGKHQMDVDEVRAAFLGSEAIVERVRAFRVDRLGRIASGEGPVSLGGGPWAVLHLLPLAAFDVPAPEVVDLETARAGRYLTAPGGGGSPRYNFDGLVSESREAFGDTLAYAQLFRNGGLEAVDADPFGVEDGEQAILATLLEEHLLEAVEKGFGLLGSLGVAPPALAMLSLLGVRGFVIPIRPPRRNLRPVDRNDLLVPEALVEGDWLSRDGVERLMKPMFDAVWNACGLVRSVNFDDDGRWQR